MDWLFYGVIVWACLSVVACIYILIIVRKELRRQKEEFVAAQFQGALEGALNPFVRDLNRGPLK